MTQVPQYENKAPAYKYPPRNGMVNVTNKVKLLQTARNLVDHIIHS